MLPHVHEMLRSPASLSLGSALPARRGGRLAGWSRCLAATNFAIDWSYNKPYAPTIAGFATGAPLFVSLGEAVTPFVADFFSALLWIETSGRGDGAGQEAGDSRRGAEARGPARKFVEESASL